MDSATIPYRPSNSTEGCEFEAKFCDRCEYNSEDQRDEMAECCLILANALAYSIGEPHFPAEWVSDANGDNPRCTRFRLLGTGTWEQAAEDRRRYELALAEMRAARGEA